jgi:hypothetical protein
MRKALCLSVVCIFALVVVSVSNVSALGKGKILYAEYLITATVKFFNEVTGDYEGGIGGGDGIVYIDDTWVDGAHAFLVNSEFGAVGSTVWFALYDYTWNATKSLLKSSDCEVEVYDPDGNPIYSYSGLCAAKITFSSAKSFTGTLTFIDAGSETVLTMKGKKLGQY